MANLPWVGAKRKGEQLHNYDRKRGLDIEKMIKRKLGLKKKDKDEDPDKTILRAIFLLF